MARTIGSDGEKTQNAIREAAVRLIARRGFEAVSMRLLAAEVGVQAAALYRYFPNKEELLFSLMREHMRGLTAAWRTQRALADQPLLHRHPRWRVWPGSVGRCHFDADRRLDICRPRSRADLARPTVAPGDYFDGGAILSKGGHLGYDLAPIVEIVGEAMPGPVAKGEINWMLLAIVRRRPCGPPPKKSCRKFAPVHRR